MSTEKTKVGLFLQKALKSIRFGAVEIVKGVVPGGSSVVKIAEHVTGKDLATGENIDYPTNWGAVIIRLSALAVFVFLAWKEYIPIEDLIKILKGLI